MATPIKDLFKKAKERREKRRKEVTETVRVTKDSEKKDVVFKGVERTSIRGRRIRAKLETPGIGTIIKRKKLSPRGERLVVKKRFAKA